MVAAELKVIGGKHAGQTIPLNRRKFLIGREQDCQLRPNSDMVSRHHCVFSIDDFSVRLRDLGSTNGTLVNGERIRKEVVLSAGDRVVIGNLEFELMVRTGVAVPESDSKVLPVAKMETEETQVSSKTVLELPVVSASAGTPAAETQQMQAAPEPEPISAAPPMPVATTETAVMTPAQMMPGQYPYQPMMQPMMPQMGYPGGMYPGYPYQQPMPGYGQMYPQMMPQMMPQMGYPMAPQMPAAEPVPAPQAGSGAVEVSLPDPDQTGAKDEVAKGSSGASPKDTEKPTGAADAIIKQYLGRRPGSGT